MKRAAVIGAAALALFVAVAGKRDPARVRAFRAGMQAATVIQWARIRLASSARLSGVDAERMQAAMQAAQERGDTLLAGAIANSLRDSGIDVVRNAL